MKTPEELWQEFKGGVDDNIADAQEWFLAVIGDALAELVESLPAQHSEPGQKKAVAWLARGTGEKWNLAGWKLGKETEDEEAMKNCAVEGLEQDLYNLHRVTFTKPPPPEEEGEPIAATVEAEEVAR